MSGMNSKNITMRWSWGITSAAALAIALVLSSLALAQESGQKTFATAQDAGKALYDAVNADDKPATLAVLGQSAANIVSSGDEVQDKNSRERFVKSFTQMNRWGLEANGDQVLYIGADNWPFTIPLKKDAAGQWYFDTKAGLQEILFRRIGKNELAAIQVCNALVDAQQEYFQEAHDGDATHQYAQKIISEPGKQNGLYWKVAEGQPESPIGPLVAFATAKGYGGEHATPQPFYGYFFHVLTAQGKNAPGGAKSYLVDGKMTGGFAFVAYPAEYRNSGVMTFFVDQNGIVYQKDLGPNSTDLGKSMTGYNPDKTWVTAEAPEQYDPGSN
ncbi:MAG: DUF2950 domain-containing protein [Candidatus Korobacteraceae bacterium]